ncbi:uncharacterized protein L201_006536 [Kwoniella dendrophila CBS 6074]|uniref:C2 domain-containing protein n=1 Tax=Kwoniella dendrophila CBS 6074 TaxID=1295534 RepID=A0AAX4K468_9TREE
MDKSQAPKLPPRRPIPQPPPNTETEPGPPISEPVASSPPTLPPRVVSKSIATGSTNNETHHTDHPRARASIGSNSIVLPPPLPPRLPSIKKPIPEAILINEGHSRIVKNDTAGESAQSPSQAAQTVDYEDVQPDDIPQPPDTAVTVAITPATPPQSEDGSSPTSPTAPSFGQSIEEMHAPLPPADSMTIQRDYEVPEPAAIPVSTETTDMDGNIDPIAQPVPPPLPPRKADPPPLPPRPSKTTNVALSTVPSVAPMVWMVSMILLAYIRVSFITLVLLGIGGYVGMKKLEKTAEKTLKEQEPEDTGPIFSGNAEGVEWVNHALYALFPLISTDVLVPFVDLMEDALAEQVPPVVTSVRLAAPALGSQPLLLTSLKPISDEQWFSSLSIPQKPSKNVLRKPSTKAGVRSPLKNRGEHKRGVSNVSLGKSSEAVGSIDMSRSRSGSSTGSGMDREERAKEASQRRKRDRILQKVSRKRAPMSDDNKIDQHQNPNPSSHGKAMDDAQSEDPEPPKEVNGDSKHGGHDEDDDLDEDDPNAGQYVNYQVGFEYKRSKDAEKKGRGLHVLAYFGWGIKGVAGSEIPVYIDVISIKGTVNLRLLLSATPPFIRTGTFSFPRLPEYDVSAHPLKKGTFNAMELPGMKQYVKQSITEVASAFVAPESYTLDLDRLLLGEESALRTHNIGVLHIIIQGAEDLPKMDTMGSCDPYISVGYSKYHKPIFSTRTIRDTREPRWEEEAFILVSSDAIESGEKLRLRACDSDRFSADDALGVVEVDLAELVDTHSSRLYRRKDEFQADSPGMRCTGSLDWSIQFHGLWQMSPEETKKRIQEKNKSEGREACEPPEVEANRVPVWMELLSKIIDKNEEKWYKQRENKRKETMAWFTGEKERDNLEVQGKPDSNLKSGILQFHIHQCEDLEVEPTSGTYSSHTTSKNSPAGGKPALESLTETTSVENPEPPSSYCEVHLNDKLIYRTRTKQVTPLPYFNAISERFVRDWNQSKITFVVRDERNREHDPILGIIVIPLKDAFRTRSQITRWFPLVGGLGWGRIRISLLWKPLDMSLPRGFSGYEVATFRLKALSFNSLGIGLTNDKGLSVLLSTDSDKYELDTSPEQLSSTPASARTSLEKLNSPSRPSLDEELELEFDLSSKHIRLAIMYRHSCSLLITLVQRSSVLKKKRIMGMGVVRLGNMIDGQGSARIGIWGTEDVEKMMRCQEVLDHEENGLHIDGNDNHGLMSPPLNGTPRKPSFRKRISSRKSIEIQHRQRQRAISVSSVNSSRTSLSLDNKDRDRDVPLLGYANLEFKLIPGVSRVHRKVAKRDLRFGKVYEVWESSKEIEMGWDKMNEGERIKDEMKGIKNDLKEHSQQNNNNHSNSSDSDSNGNSSSSDSGDSDDDDNSDDEKQKNENDLVKDDISDSEDELDRKMSERKAHSHALHKRHKGIFQLKIARTGRYVKDKLSAKVYAAAHSGGNKDQSRNRGTDLEVEREGISKM